MDDLNAKYRITIILIVAQIMTILALTVAAWFELFSFETAASPSTVTALWIVIIFFAVGSFVLRRTFFSWERLTDTTLLKGVKGLINQLQTNAIILSVCAEAIAILGFIITALTGDKFQMIRAAAIALIVCLINFPRRKVWENVVGRLEKLDARG